MLSVDFYVSIDLFHTEQFTDLSAYVLDSIAEHSAVLHIVLLLDKIRLYLLGHEYSQRPSPNINDYLRTIQYIFKSPYDNSKCN